MCVPLNAENAIELLINIIHTNSDYTFFYMWAVFSLWMYLLYYMYVYCIVYSICIWVLGVIIIISENKLLSVSFHLPTQTHATLHIWGDESNKLLSKKFSALKLLGQSAFDKD